MTLSPQMGRPKIRIAVLAETTRDVILAAFGTVWNSHRQLGLDDVSYPVFARAMRGATIAPETWSAIVVAWEHRRRQPVDPTVTP